MLTKQQKVFGRNTQTRTGFTLLALFTIWASWWTFTDNLSGQQWAIRLSLDVNQQNLSFTVKIRLSTTLMSKILATSRFSFSYLTSNLQYRVRDLWEKLRSGKCSYVVGSRWISVSSSEAQWYYDSRRGPLHDSIPLLLSMAHGRRLQAFDQRKRRVNDEVGTRVQVSDSVARNRIIWSVVYFDNSLQ